MIGLPMAHRALGRMADSDAALAALIAKYERDAPYNIAFVYAIRWRTSTGAISRAYSYTFPARCD